jgi:hypothetical protein
VLNFARTIIRRSGEYQLCATLDAADGNIMGSNGRPARVQDDGSFVLENVAPLKYRVFVNAAAGGYVKSAQSTGRMY